jgi:tetratricopeptide (TPR) repeat protein
VQPSPPRFQEDPTETSSVLRGDAPLSRRRGNPIAALLLLCVSALSGTPTFDYAQIEQAIREHRLSWAQQRLEVQILAEPEDFRAHMLLGSVFSERGQPDSAVKHFEQAARLQPREAAPHLRIGESCARRGKFSAALAEFRKAVALAPADRSAWLNLLEAQLALKRFGEAQTSAERISQLDPASADLYNRLGAIQAEFGDYAGAIANLEKATALQPESYEFRYNLALAYHRNGDGARALQILEPMRRQRADGEIENLLGEVYEKKGQHLEAVRAFQRSAEREPANENYRFDFVYELLAHQNFDAALAAAQPAIRDFPQSLKLRLALGVAYFGAKSFDQSGKIFLEAARGLPDAELPLRLLAMAVDTGPVRRQDVQALVAAYLKRHPKQSWPHYFLGRNAFQDGDVARGLELLKQSVALVPDYPDSQFELGNVYFEMERWKEAIACYEKAVRLKPNLAEAHYRLFRSYRRTGEPKQADRALRTYQRLQQKKEADNVVMQFVYELRQ